ncbi:hypothetical protein PICMEDRAFT_12041 [Pichia membranifaciens NRRL Y-2026]|uniref:Uncharacterized protein n=1 Tax=Pichia membranifaciens NRRL Y-2026 TaxID=763406 RepID=A0A1E3NHH9_9ASCO|nr:hypothetical protein PICMEDRAFT_12041 [Pichia membranifaciens NRRL Y-2026]ODQ45582.1 hypothetical protein PICMEDRAFT_12041 [Pichia membranifaciens NRRL Y-2026]
MCPGLSQHASTLSTGHILILHSALLTLAVVQLLPGQAGMGTPSGRSGGEGGGNIQQGPDSWHAQRGLHPALLLSTGENVLALLLFGAGTELSGTELQGSIGSRSMWVPLGVRCSSIGESPLVLNSR